jgi:hypothetical protein
MTTPLSHTGRSLLNRRTFLGNTLGGLGAMALAQLLRADDKLATVRAAHFAPKARRSLVIFCSGALSHVDTFDYKPELIKRHNTPMPGADKLVTFQGAQGNLVAPIRPFKPRGQCGKMLSDLLPNIASLADDLCFIHSMTAKSNTHGPAENQMSTGFTLDGFPGMGCWINYALGSECADLPAFVAIPDPRGVPQVASNHWNSAFLPAMYQGVAFNADKPIANLSRPAKISRDADIAARDFARFLNDQHLSRNPGDADLAARIAAYEMAGRMQIAAADVGDLSRESRATHELYGTGDANKIKAGFARNCLLARRLLERGVRFVQLFNGAYAMGEGVGNWDGHKAIDAQYSIHAPILDQPIAALLKDMKSRGLFDDTLIAFVTEFGRMPTFQKGASGRDHNPHGFSVFLAGAGVRAPFSYGSTDEFGHNAAQDEVTIYDLHATILHLLGLDHEKLTYYHNGTQRRLTDVHGEVVTAVLANRA